MYFSNCSSGSLAKVLVRISFGLALLFTGIAHYRDAANYAVNNVGANLQYPWLIQLGTWWGYVLPFLMIIGGVLFVIAKLPKIAVWTAGLALASIPAGLMLKSAVSGMSLGETMPGAMNAYVWILVFVMNVWL